MNSNESIMKAESINTTETRIQENYESFNVHLAPYFRMLESRLPEMDTRLWLTLVRRMELGIAANPSQYIADLTQPTTLVAKTVHELFKNFIELKLEEFSLL